MIVNKKTPIYPRVDFAVPTNYRVKLNESEKMDKYVDLASELKQLLNMKMPVRRIVLRAFGRVTKSLVLGLEDLEIRGPVEIIQTTALLWLARILRGVLETCWLTPAENHQLALMWKNSQMSKIIIIIIMIITWIWDIYRLFNFV